MATPTPGKDTIYIDIDDEITAVIDKVRASQEKIVALVLPKRASVLQSIVNMKLLKRSADSAKKHVVLITAEAGLLPLAGAVGFHVAKNLQSKPEIPSTAAQPDEDEVLDEEPLDGPDTEPEITAANAGDKPIGELAAAAGGAEAVETLDMDDDSSDMPADAASDMPTKAKKNRKLAIPNFDKFRLRLALGILALILLGVLFYICSAVLPKGTVTLSTDTSDVNSSLTLNLDTTAKTLDTDKLIIPATSQQLQKSGSQQVATTGKKNNGTKASGTVTMSAGSCSADVPASISSGIPLTTSGLTFITQESISFVPVIHSGKCTYQGIGGTSGTSSIAIGAQAGGANYNVSSASFSVYQRSDVTANGTTTGGTDNIVQVVSQTDIDSATQKITAQNTDAVKSQLQDQLKQAGQYPIASTFTAGDPATTSSSKVGDEASTLTVTEATTYTMLGVKQSDLKTLVDNDVKKHIDVSKQSILTEGLDKATYHVNNSTATTATVALTTTATAGPDLKADMIKSEITGKKSGDITALLKEDPGVTAVDVKFSPFWVNKAPKPSKLTIIFQKASP